MWNEISIRQGQLTKSWCIIGDFNYIRRQEERKSLVDVNVTTRTHDS